MDSWSIHVVLLPYIILVICLSIHLTINLIESFDLQRMHSDAEKFDEWTKCNMDFLCTVCCCTPDSNFDTVKSFQRVDDGPRRMQAKLSHREWLLH